MLVQDKRLACYALLFRALPVDMLDLYTHIYAYTEYGNNMVPLQFTFTGICSDLATQQVRFLV